MLMNLVHDSLNSKYRRYVWKPDDYYRGLRCEALDRDLGRAYRLFDQYCSEHGIEFSVDCDEHNEQGYLVRHDQKIDNLITHMETVIDGEGLAVVLDVDRRRKDGVLFHLATKPIMDNRDQLDVVLDDFGSRSTRICDHSSLEQRLDEEVLGLKSPDILITMNQAMPSGAHEEFGTRKISYTFQAGEEDLRLLDSVIKAIEGNKLEEVSGIHFTGSVRVGAPDSETADTEKLDDSMPAPADDLGSMLADILDTGLRPLTQGDSR